MWNDASTLQGYIAGAPSHKPETYAMPYGSRSHSLSVSSLFGENKTT